MRHLFGDYESPVRLLLKRLYPHSKLRPSSIGVSKEILDRRHREKKMGIIFPWGKSPQEGIILLGPNHTLRFEVLFKTITQDLFVRKSGTN